MSHSPFFSKWLIHQFYSKENANTYSENSTSQENIRISRLRRKDCETSAKQNLQELQQNLQDENYQLENKQAKDDKLCANIPWELEGKKCSNAFFKVLERQNLQNQTISELYTDDNKSKYSSNPKEIFKSAKKNYEKLYTKEAISKATTTAFLNKILDRKEISNKKFNFY